MSKEVIVACDFSSKEETLAFLDLFSNQTLYVKIGMELYYSCGVEIVKEIKKRGHKVFLDLKLHDIPNTVKRTMASLARLDVDMVNVHAAGGVKMMMAAKEGLIEGSKNKRPIILAVTQLTSTDDHMLHEELLIKEEINDVVSHYAKMTKLAGLDGVVCSPLEVQIVKEACLDDFCTVTPGVRFADAKQDDQVRITTPQKAREIGSDYIVVGRPITQAENPQEAYNRCVKEFTNHG